MPKFSLKHIFALTAFVAVVVWLVRYNRPLGAGFLMGAVPGLLGGIVALGVILAIRKLTGVIHHVELFYLQPTYSVVQEEIEAILANTSAFTMANSLFVRDKQGGQTVMVRLPFREFRRLPKAQRQFLRAHCVSIYDSYGKKPIRMN
ncbi:MAG: hypothetical protein U0836_16190 [Pirellulales bacterium]